MGVKKKDGAIGVMFVLVFVDMLTKYVMCVALKKATTKAIMKVLTNKYIPNVGKPKCILSDKGTQYTSTSTRATMVKNVECYLNNVTHDSTGYTPNELHFGQIRINNFIKKINFPNLEEKGSDVIVLAQDRLRSKAEKRRARHDRLKNITRFKLGDKVLVCNHERSSAINKEIKKLFLLFKGPYIIKRIVGPNSYELCDVSGESMGIHNVVNIKNFVEPISML